MYIYYILVNTIIILERSFMISLCFKSQFKETIDELDLFMDTISFPNIIYCKRRFSKFYNLIIHYTGKQKQDFCSAISMLFSQYIISKHEEKIISKQLKLDFFYFSNYEQTEILSQIKQYLASSSIVEQKTKILQNSLNSYLEKHNRINVEGVINFRIKDYLFFINNIVGDQINSYVINKEYNEYVSLLSDYISSKPSQTSKIHLVYTEKEKSLFDCNGNIITTTYDKKYLSDISFSDNDFILNSILSLMPQEIVIHPQDINDKFVSFIHSIFKNRCNICTECKFCSKYKYKKSALE